MGPAPPAREHRSRDFALAIALFSLSAAMSVLLDAGIVGTNDGSHYALVRAIADKQTVVIDEFASYTRNVDISRRNEHYYSDRAPGTALLALPFYFAARSAGLSDKGRQEVCVLLSVLAGALAVVLTYFCGRRLGMGKSGATVAALTLALCTPHRTYSTSLWSHALSACLVVCSAWLATPAAPPTQAEQETPPSFLSRLMLGLVAGYSVGVDFSAAVVSLILVGVVAASALQGARARGQRLPWRTLGPLFGGLLVGILPALVYNTLAFGSPLRTGYSFHMLFPETRSLLTMYSGSFLAGLWGLLFSWQAGLLIYSPILVLGMAFTPRLVRELGARRALVAVLPWVAMLLLTAKHATWHGGGAHDARYLMLVMPLICLPVGAAYERAKTPGALQLFSGLFLLSVLVQFFKHTIGWVRNPMVFVSEVLCTMKFDDDGVHYFNDGALWRMLGWLYPHPLAAAAILVLGLGAAALVYGYGLGDRARLGPAKR